MTNLDTITQPTRRATDPIGQRSRHDAGASTAAYASFEDVFDKTYQDAATPASGPAATSSGAEVREPDSDLVDRADGADSVDSEHNVDGGDARDTSIESELADDELVTQPFQPLTQDVAVAGADMPVAAERAVAAANANEVDGAAGSAQVVPAFEPVVVADASTPASTVLAVTGDVTVAPKPAAIQAVTAAASGLKAPVDQQIVPDADAEMASERQAAIAVTARVSADDATGSDVGIDDALTQAAARVALADAEPMRPADTQTSRPPLAQAVDAGATSDLAGIDASSGDQAAPEAATILTAAPRGTEASTRVGEHVAMRELFDRIERHRSSIDGSIELEILTDRFGAIRIEATEGRDGVHLSLRGGNGDERALADLADELRQEFERNGTDLAGLDVGGRQRGRSGPEPVDSGRVPFASAGMPDPDGLSPSYHGSDAGRLDLRL